MIHYNQFYRKYGIRQQGLLARPMLHSLTSFQLPFNSILHHLGEDGTLMSASDLAYQGNAGRYVMTQHVVSLAEDATLGNPINIPTDRNLLMRHFHQKNLKFRLTRDYTIVLNDAKQLVTFNYAFLERLYRYPKTPLQPYYEWCNHYRTMWENVAAIAPTTTRQHFVMMDLPMGLAAPSIYQKYETSGLNLSMLARQFTNPKAFALADLWTWLGAEREKSILSVLPTEVLNKVNLVWVETGHWTVINLGLLEAWRNNPEVTEAMTAGFTANLKLLGANAGQLDPLQMQRRMLRMWMSLIEARSVSDVDELSDQELDIKGQASPASVDNDANRDADGELVFNPAQADEAEVTIDGQLDDIEIPTMVPNAKPTQMPVNATPPTETTDDSAPKKKSRYADAKAQDATKPEELDVGDVELDLPPDESDIMDDKAIDADLAALEKTANEAEVLQEESVGYKPYVPPTDSMEAGVTDSAKRLVARGVLSPAQYRRMEQLAVRYKEIPNPYERGTKLDALTHLTTADVEMAVKTPIAPSVSGVSDASMLSSSLNRFDRDYVREVMKKDVVKMALNVQKAGIAIQNYEVDRIDELNGSYEIHTVKVVPVIGTPSTLRFNLPVVDDNGTFRAKGVKYRMRKQRGDLPIRKISPSEVAMTSYYSKLFVSRSDRAVFNYSNWLLNQITARAVDTLDDSVTDIKLGDVFVNEAKVPRIYSTIAMRCSEFKSGEYHFFFDYDKRERFFGPDTIKAIEGKKGLVPVGKAAGDILIMDTKNVVHRIVAEGDKHVAKPLGTLEQILKLPAAKAPVEIAEVGIYGKAIPIGIVLTYETGLGNLLETLKPDYRRVATRERYVLGDDEFDVRFEDEALIFKRSDKTAQLIFGGFNRYRTDIRRYSVYHFDKKETIAAILDNNGLGSRFPREMDLMFKMWVDHITRELLVEMKEPTDLFNLFISAVRKLETDDHPLAVDNLFMRDKGYERFAGLMYGEIVRSMRQYSGKPANAKATVDLNPYAVWKAITDDATVTVVEDSNPLGNLQEKEVVVFRGGGGRSARSMTAKHRAFHKNGIGVVSEATPDNGDTATITYLTADPSYRSLRGTIEPVTKVDGNMARVVSTSTMMAPGAEHDDPKRINFISIQNKQTTHCVGYTPMPCRTGYERVIAHRTDDLYAKTARLGGVVDAVTDKTISVTYSDGERVSYELGRRFGVWAGNNIPHMVTTERTKGEVIRPGDVLCYNSNFFEPDNLDPNQVVMKTGALARTALFESTDTLEDSCTISEELAARLSTTSTEIRIVQVTNDQEIRNALKVGDVVDVESILCTIENTTAGRSELFDDAALDTLKLLSNLTPKAKARGVIERIEAVYTGDVDEMSPSIRAIVERSDQDIYRLNKQLGKPAVSGQVAVGFRINGQEMGVDVVAIRYYITGPVSMGIGDKGVFANQMKSVVGRVMLGENTTESGEAIDAVFSYQSIAKRVVLSAELIGTTNRLCVEVGRLALEAYRSS